MPPATLMPRRCQARQLLIRFPRHNATPMLPAFAAATRYAYAFSRATPYAIALRHTPPLFFCCRFRRRFRFSLRALRCRCGFSPRHRFHAFHAATTLRHIFAARRFRATFDALFSRFSRCRRDAFCCFRRHDAGLRQAFTTPYYDDTPPFSFD